MGIRKEVLLCLATALATAAGLFALQGWYASYLDVSVIHGQQRELPAHARLQAVRSEEQAQLSSGPLPIDQAMAALAQRGRSAFPKLAARPSDDLSAMSGWVHKPGFMPYVPRQRAEPAALATQLAPSPEAALSGARGSAPEGRQ